MSDKEDVVVTPHKEKREECIATEEYAVISDSILSSPELPTFHKRKHDIFRRLQVVVSECRANFSGRKELATEDNYCVANLCDHLEIAFQYGLKQQQQEQQLPNLVASAAANLFQNMQEIVTGTSKGIAKSSNVSMTSTNPCFWDFCKKFLTTHERERFEQLKQTWTKWGKGRAFIRASLNEHSLHRYILTWLSDRGVLHSHYSHWALLTDETIASALADLIKSLDQVLFALAVDKTELNAAVKTFQPIQEVVVKDEPVIYAPTPIKIESKTKGKYAVVERPIKTSSSTEDLLQQIQLDSTTVKAERQENDYVMATARASEDLLQQIQRDPTSITVKAVELGQAESYVATKTSPEFNKSMPSENDNYNFDTECESSDNDVPTELKLLKKTFLEFSSSLPSSDKEEIHNIHKSDIRDSLTILPELHSPLPSIDVDHTNDISVEQQLESLRETFKEFTTTLPSNGPMEIKSSQTYCTGCDTSTSQQQYICNNPAHTRLEDQLKEANDKCLSLETKVAELTLENIQLMMRLKKYMQESNVRASPAIATKPL